MTKPSLDNAPEHETLKVLREDGLISSASFWRGIREVNREEDWAVWASRLCLLVGSSLLLAALVFFFAFNWDALESLQKMGLLQGVTLLALIAGQFAGFNHIGGKLLLMASAICVGVSFAVFGQVYQTGADAFGFFGIWAICIIPWVLAGAFAPLWVLWFALVNLTALFFWEQVGQFQELIHYGILCTALALINSIGLILRERLQTRYEWLRGSWLRALFLLSTLVVLLIPSINLILENPSEGGITLLLCTLLLLLCLGASFLYYTRCKFDSTALCIVIGSAAAYLVTGIGRLLDLGDLYHGGGGYLLMALIIGGITTACVHLLRRLKRHFGQTGKDLA